MSAKNEGYIQVTAAAKAGISDRSGRRIEKGETTPGVKPNAIGEPAKIHLQVSGKARSFQCWNNTLSSSR